VAPDPMAAAARVGSWQLLNRSSGRRDDIQHGGVDVSNEILVDWNRPWETPKDCLQKDAPCPDLP